jgi:hypothetical protein
MEKEELELLYKLLQKNKRTHILKFTKGLYRRTKDPTAKRVRDIYVASYSHIQEVVADQIKNYVPKEKEETKIPA